MKVGNANVSVQKSDNGIAWMPLEISLNENITTRARYMQTHSPVSYMTWNGTSLESTTTNTAYTIVTDSDSAVTWDAGWYVVAGNNTITDRITVSGTVNLILCDDCTLTASKGITVSVNNALNIYGQSAGTGKLYAGCYPHGGVAINEGYAAIGGNNSNCGTITINGGSITANGGYEGAGIGGGYKGGGGTVIINGGNVIAKSDYEGAGIGGGGNGNGGRVTINGGTVKAFGGLAASGIGIGYHGTNAALNVYGGNIEATGGDGVNNKPAGAGIYCGMDEVKGNASITATGGNGEQNVQEAYITPGGDGIYGIINVIGDSPEITATGGEGSVSGNGIKKGVYIDSAENVITVTSGSPKITATGGTNASGIAGDVGVANEATPTILAISGITGDLPYAIYGSVVKPDTLNILQSTSASGPWSTIVPDNEGVNAKYVKISTDGPTPAPTPPSPPSPGPSPDPTPDPTPEPTPTPTPQTETDPDSPAYGKEIVGDPVVVTEGDKTTTTTEYADGTIGVKTEVKGEDGSSTVTEVVTNKTTGDFISKNVDTASDGSKVETDLTSDAKGDNYTKQIIKTDKNGKVTETIIETKSTDATTGEVKTTKETKTAEGTTTEERSEKKGYIVEKTYKTDADGHVIESKVKTETTSADGTVAEWEEIKGEGGTYTLRETTTYANGDFESTTKEMEASGEVTFSSESKKTEGGVVTETKSTSDAYGDNTTKETVITAADGKVTTIKEQKTTDGSGNVTETKETTNSDRSGVELKVLTDADGNHSANEVTKGANGIVESIRQEDAPKGEEPLVQEYGVDGTDLTLTSLDTKAENVTIPETIKAANGKNYTVKKLGKCSLDGSKLNVKSISVPETVKKFDKGAMKGCKYLKELMLGLKGRHTVRAGENGEMNLVSSDGSEIELGKNCLKGTSKKLVITVSSKADKKAVKKQLKKAGNPKAKVKVVK